MPSEAKGHTPGPWRECGADRGGCICRQIWSVPDDAKVAIAVEKDKFSPIPPEVAHANAKLIAAAPALLAACEPIDAAAAMKTPFWEEDWNTNAHVEITLTIAECRAIRSAIAQAKTT